MNKFQTPKDFGVIYGLYCGEPACGDNLRYIGLTTQKPTMRLSYHKRDAKSGSPLPVHRWIRKHGADNIRIKVLSEAHQDSLPELEIKAIEMYRTHVTENGLNVTRGGEGSFGTKRSEEFRRDRSVESQGENNPGNKYSEAQIREVKSLLWAGWSHSDISEKTGVPKPSISSVNQGVTWKHIPWPEGERTPTKPRCLSKEQSKAPDDVVRFIRQEYSKGVSVSQISRSTGLGWNVVKKIATFKTYWWVE